MLTPRTTLARRLVAALDATPSRIPVLLGGCGSGRSVVMQQLRDRLGRTSAQYIDVDRTATTPERFLRAVTAASPFAPGDIAAHGTRAAFDATLAFFNRARSGGSEPATFLLDEFLELRTFESFPGLRRVLPDLIDGLAASGNRFVLSSRYSARALRLLRDRSARFEVIHVPALTAEDTLDMLGPGAGFADTDAHDAEYAARAVHALGDGRPAYVQALVNELATLRDRGLPGGSDAVSAFAALIAPGGALARQCAFSYELRLHRARGYGALKAILEILGDEEGLTLTEISLRLHRTPGSTKDYLSWLEDVDLVAANQKRYRFVDPVLRLWVRLHCRPVAPTEDEVAREVHRYAMPRLPNPADGAAPTPPAPPPEPEPALALAAAGPAPSDEDRKEWGIIEID
jgi:hypothetical protein